MEKDKSYTKSVESAKEFLGFKHTKVELEDFPCEALIDCQTHLIDKMVKWVSTDNSKRLIQSYAESGYNLCEQDQCTVLEEVFKDISSLEGRILALELMDCRAVLNKKIEYQKYLNGEILDPRD